MELTLVESEKLSRKRQTPVLTTLEVGESNTSEVSRGGKTGQHTKGEGPDVSTEARKALRAGERKASGENISNFHIYLLTNQK